MCEVFGYIFGSLRSSERAVQSIQRTLKHQRSFNRNVAVLAIAMTAYMVTNEIDRKKQNEKIEKLSNEVKELRRPEGE